MHIACGTDSAMATIGKDGKDDSARLAALGAAAVSSALSALPSVTSSSSRYFRVNYSLSSPPSPDIVARHVEFAERLTLVGYVDAYGAQKSDAIFVVFNAASTQEATALANVSPLVIDAGATVAVQTLDAGASIWK